jgi:pimeloyl-ACP methyl ester carboxylesterase
MTMALAPAIESYALGRVDVGDGDLPVAIAGGGPSLVMLHGWTLDHRMWQPQIAALGAHFRLIMPDRRGFGGSTAPANLAREVDDIVRIADALGLDRFALAGLSQGAAVALDFAIRYPDRLHAVALAGTPLPGLVPNADSVPRDEFAAMVRNGAFALMRRTWLAHPLMHVDNAEARARLARIVDDYDGRDLLTPSTLPPFTREAIAALPMPLCAITGSDETPWRIACAQLLAQAAPHGQFVMIADAGHIANVAQPEAFNTILTDFLGIHVPTTV